MGSNKQVPEISRQIKLLREKAGLKQRELAEMLNTSRETINMWESGARMIKGDDIVRLAEALNTTCDYLLRGVESENLGTNQATGLSDKAIKWLRSAKESKQAYIEVLNTLLEDSVLADALFSAMWVYANSKYTKITTDNVVIESKQEYDLEDSRAMLKYSAQESMSLVLDVLYKKYGERIDRIADKKLELLESSVNGQGGNQNGQYQENN